MDDGPKTLEGLTMGKWVDRFGAVIAAKQRVLRGEDSVYSACDFVLQDAGYFKGGRASTQTFKRFMREVEKEVRISRC